MASLNKYVQEYRAQLEKGDIKHGYQGLMQYMMDLRTRFHEKHPDYFVSGSIYQGQMNFTFFQFTPKVLKEKGLKVLVLLNHEKMSFESWLCGVNKKHQKEYWSLLKQSNWDKYCITNDITRRESIIEYSLIENPDFDKLDELTKVIEMGTLAFIGEIEKFFEVV